MKYANISGGTLLPDATTVKTKDHAPVDVAGSTTTRSMGTPEIPTLTQVATVAIRFEHSPGGTRLLTPVFGVPFPKEFQNVAVTLTYTPTFNLNCLSALNR